MSVVNRFDRWLDEEISPQRAVLVYILLALYYGALLFPIAWMIISTFKVQSLLFAERLIIIPPLDGLTLKHWRDVLTQQAFRQYFLNSAIVATGTTILTVTLATLAGYSVSRKEFPGRVSLIMIYLATTMLPRVLILIPFFLIMYWLDLINTFVGLILAHTIIALPFVTWLLKGYFDDIPTSLDDAAKMDGCSDFQLLFYVILPLALPGLAVGAFFTFVVSWNDYLFVSIISTTAKTRTLPFALQLFQTQNSIDWGAVITAATVTMIPVIVLFAFAQNYLVEGLASGGMKGS